MTVEVCPYCRTAPEVDDAVTVCDSCGTRHHSDCYVENGGCTIFGCKNAPPEEPKLTVSTPELSNAVAAGSNAEALTAVAPPPPPPGSRVTDTQSFEELQRISSTVVPSMFSIFTPESSNGSHLIETAELPQAEPKDRTTFIVLGALLGALGAHNFYAGYIKKGIAQLAITILTFGFASPMSWIWAIIDICTVDQDKTGVQFQS